MKELTREEVAFLQALWGELTCLHEPSSKTITDEEISQFLGPDMDHDQTDLINGFLNDASARKRLVELYLEECKSHNEEVSWSPFEGEAECWRPAELSQLISHLNSGKQVLGVIGPKGFGKSHLMNALHLHLRRTSRPVIYFERCAEWSADLLERRIRRQIDSQDIIFCTKVQPVLLLDALDATDQAAALVHTINNDYPSLQVVYSSTKAIGTSKGHGHVQLGKLASHDALTFLQAAIEKQVNSTHSRQKFKPTHSRLSRLIGVPFALGLAAGCLAQFTPEALESQLRAYESQADIASQRVPEDSQVAALSSLLLESLGIREECCLTAFLACDGPVDPEFAHRLLSGTNDAEHLVTRLIDSGLLVRLGNKVELSPSIRRALSSDDLPDRMKVLQANGTFSHMGACRHFADKIAQLSVEGNWSAAWSTYELYEHEFRKVIGQAINDNLDEDLRSLSLGICRLLFESEELESFDKLVDASISAAGRLQDRDFHQRMLGLKGARLLRSGLVSEARETWEARLCLGMELADPECAIDASVDLGSLEYEAGNHIQASNHLRLAEELARSQQAFELLASVYMIRAHLFIRDEHPEAARDCLEQADSLRMEFRRRDLALYVHQSRCSLLLQLGETERARQLVIELLGNANEGQRKVVISWCLRKLAEIEEIMGNHGEAKRLLCAAIGVHGNGYSRHKQIGINRLGLLLNTDSRQEIGAALEAETAPWQSVVEALLPQD